MLTCINRSLVQLVLWALLVAAGVALFFVPRHAPEPGMERLTWVADAHQFGPVGYRDPAGAISPDGRWIAYSEGRFLLVRAAEGGPFVELPPGEAQIRNIAWSPDNRTILADAGGLGAVRSCRWQPPPAVGRSRSAARREDFRSAPAGLVT
jgi:hypothetical protein